MSVFSLVFFRLHCMREKCGEWGQMREGSKPGVKGDREGERERARAGERGDQAQTVVAGEGGACSLPEVGGVIEWS